MSDPTTAPEAPAHVGTDGPIGAVPATGTETTTSAAPAAESSTAATTTETKDVVAEPKKEETVSKEVQEKSTATETKPTEKRVVVDKKDVKPISEGVLGYKAPGLLHRLIFKKCNFSFGEAPIETKSLKSYLRGEKPEVSHPTAAWASVTGKGLLLFSKAGDTTSEVIGVINLAEISDVTKDNYDPEFFFKLHNEKHTFKAATTAERDSWVFEIESRAEQAKESAEGVKTSTVYGDSLKSIATPAVALTGPATVAAVSRKSTDKAVEKKDKEVVEPAKKDSHSTKSDSDEESKKKSRSQSRKRGSIFGSLLGKKDDAEEKVHEKKAEKEEKKQEKKVEKEEKKIEKEEAKEAKEATKSDEISPASAAPVVAAAPAAAEPSKKEVEEPVKATEPTTSEPTTPLKEKKEKRGSIFGAFFPKKEEKPATSDKVVDKDAPVLKETTEPEASVTEPTTAATAPTTETKEPKTEEGAAAAAAPVAIKEAVKEKKAEKEVSKEKPSSPPKESFFSKFTKKEKAKTEEKKEVKEETKAVEESSSAAKPAKSDTFTDSAVAAGVAAAAGTGAATTTTPETPATTDKTTTDILPDTEPAKTDKVIETSKIDPIAPVSAAAASPTTPEAGKEKRRSSFFGLGSKKETKAESDAEASESEPKEKKGFGALLRSTSKAMNRKVSRERGNAAPATVPETSESTAPKLPATETVSEPKEILPTEPVTGPAAPAAAKEGPTSIGDVVPDAVEVGQKATPEVKASA